MFFNQFLVESYVYVVDLILNDSQKQTVINKKCLILKPF